MRHHESLQLIMDSLRYWVTEMHVDGFRFDLAATLAREFHEVDRLAAFFDLVHQDPVVSQVKLIAEPWDVGEGGYQVGNFPPLWTEWNGKYRDTVRDFWRGEPREPRRVRLPVHRLLRPVRGRRPPARSRRSTSSPRTTASPCNDLVSYNEKHNEANGEDNRDGESHNRSWNCGVEGPTEDGEVRVLRERQKRNFLATLLLSQGVPMIAHGDELGRTQRGNNNVYCQDNELSWVDWDDGPRRTSLLRVHRTVSRAARRAPGLPAPAVLPGPAHPRLEHRGHRLAAPGRAADERRGLERRLRPQRSAIFLNGKGIPERDDVGEQIVDDSFLLLFNAHHQQMMFTLPDEAYGQTWRSSSTRPTRCSPTRGGATPCRTGGCGSRRGRCSCCAPGTSARRRGRTSPRRSRS